MSIGGARGGCLVAHFGNKTRIAHDEGCGNEDSTDDSNGQQNRQQHQPTASSLLFSTSSGSKPINSTNIEAAMPGAVGFVLWL